MAIETDITIRTRGKFVIIHWPSPEGGAAKTPTLWLHGWMDNSATFETLAPRLTGHLNSFALDLAGHGKTPAKRGVYHFSEWIKDIEAVRSHFDWHQFNLVGHSLGGAIAAVYAACFSEFIANLVLLDSLGPLSSIDEKSPVLRLRRHVSWKSKTTLQRRFSSIEEACAARKKSAIAISDAAAMAICRRGIKSKADGLFWSHDRNLSQPSPYRLSEQAVQDILRGIACPTLVILGDQGLGAVKNEHIKNRLSCLSQGTVKTLAGNHYVHFDAAEAAADTIKRFLDTPKK